MPTELEHPWLDSPQSFSFIAFRQYLQRNGFDSNAIRYRSTASLAHPSSEVSAAWLNVFKGQPKLTVDVSLMGLYGTTSPLPAFYTERILGLDLNSRDDFGSSSALAGSEYQESQDLKQFYDLFNHQAISLFYDAWAKYRISSRLIESPQNNLDNRDDQAPANEFSTALMALWGIDSVRLDAFSHLTLPRLMPLAGLLASRCASIDVLDQALNLFFDDTEIKSHALVSGQIAVPEDQLNCLGRDNVTLGESLVLGQRVADCSGMAVTVRLTSLRQIDDWLPGGVLNETARELIALIIDAPNDYQLELDIGDTLDDLSEIGDMAKGLGWGVGLGAVKCAKINV
ncbi:type VI secretion system baseplate subunit TssG [Alkalimarinus alittae]|uniref:Type VI secretion system baseplate subunit TssG n=1 Tax=Alkalimarinus alittae TaxID=2961619 RepID=A0ABY6MZ90_9ALTE|nr:type VI secretion system baseplate subunit TssG [Alkalimarinus alittae]UZE95102.1 type VI secretion system baseplate subunit TssG [Alkalimarinus alittae]